MKPKVSVLTPTCDRPLALKLCEALIHRQTRRPDEWVVADGSMNTASLYWPKWAVVAYTPQCPGAVNFCSNILRGLEWVTGDYVVIMEDDDWYHPTHIERAVATLEANPHLWAVGDPWQRYYNPTRGVWKVYKNIGSSMAQTAIRHAAVPALKDAARALLAQGKYGVDRYFWDRLPPDWKLIETYDTVVGMKGLPGQPGLGVGHRPTHDWTPDPDGAKLKEWIGEDAELYRMMAPDATIAL